MATAMEMKVCTTERFGCTSLPSAEDEGLVWGMGGTINRLETWGTGCILRHQMRHPKCWRGAQHVIPSQLGAAQDSLALETKTPTRKKAGSLVQAALW